MNPEFANTGQSGWPACVRNPLYFPSAGITGMSSIAYTGSGDLNSRPQTHKASALRADHVPSSTSQNSKKQNAKLIFLLSHVWREGLICSGTLKIADIEHATVFLYF